MTGMDVSLFGALLAGILSFLSPCVLPLVPPYLAFLGGVTIEAAEQDSATSPFLWPVVNAAIAFVTGFTTVFVALGATASAVSGLITAHLDVLGIIAGVVILILGLHFLGLFRILALYREIRVHPESRPAGLFGAFLVGMAFAFGWTPCVGPVLAAILLVAASEDSMIYGATLLGTYALGIGVPFLLAALFVQPFLKFMRRFRRHLGKVEKAMGAFLVLTGIFFITGQVSEVAYWLLETFPSLGRIG